MFDMKAISPVQFDAWDNFPLHWRKELEETGVSEEAGFKYWEEDKFSEGYCFDPYSWSRVL